MTPEVGIGGRDLWPAGSRRQIKVDIPDRSMAEKKAAAFRKGYLVWYAFCVVVLLVIVALMARQ